MFDNYNQFTKVFRMARDRVKESDLRKVHIRLIGNRGRDARQYNMRTTSEVAALIVSDLSETNVERDVIVEHRSDGLQRISDLNPSFMAMQYPILFPYGEDGYHLGIPYKCNKGRRQMKRHCVTMREYYAYRIQQRESESQTIIRGGSLFQQFLVDAFTAIEEERLPWIRNIQPQLRADLYKGLRDAVVRGDTTPSSVGRRIILPSSFTGSPRYMVQNYQDAMAICRWAENPDLFITFTANPKWHEIQKFVDQIPLQKPTDRPDIESRVFKIKLDQLMRDLIKLQHFGRVIAAVYTIEFQKRGLPHTHILLWLHQSDKYPTSSKIDKIISAEIPDETSDYTAYAAVAEYMMHGPCGAANNKAPCMNGGNYCSKKFPKFFYTETTLSEGRFPIYRRRDNDRFVQKGEIKLDNRYVAPHNVDLIVKYQSHINIEWCNRSRAIKYLFKYINKGPDRTTMIVEEDISRNRGNDNREIQRIDEIKSYLDCRYVSACEACWRIFQFDIQHRTPAIERMAFHLPDEQCITFRDSEPINQVLNKEDVETTMFTQWMHTNSVEEGAQNLTFAEFPTKFVYNKKDKMWQQRKKGKCIGRIVYAHPSSGERFYLRMLLNIVKGPRSYEEIEQSTV
ncbi:uncharacterized protein LOC143891975 [Tasmannia lanceolata]|uniref:uncharacterized protein LOC143891975 n=1 Tax=Tasmannia lanceolata TaxID=3420 RepID=UPI0040633CD6